MMWYWKKSQFNNKDGIKDRIGGFISSLNIVQKIIFYIVCIHFYLIYLM